MGLRESNLATNKRILENLKRQLSEIQDDSQPLKPHYLRAFPSKNEAEIRELLIKARTADIANYEHIIEQTGG